MPSPTCERYTLGCEDIFTFWHSHKGSVIALQSAATVSFTCSTLCFYIKAWVHYLHHKKTPLTICQTADLQCMLEFPLSHSFPLSLLSELQITAFFWRSGFALQTSSWRLSQAVFWSEGLRWTPWKNWLETRQNEANRDSQTSARAESLTPHWCQWHVRNPVHTREEDPLNFGTKDYSTSHTAVQEAGVCSTSHLPLIE